jgi:predicted transcriptional regulator
MRRKGPNLLARISDEAKAKLKEIAEKDRRTIGATLELLIEQEYERRKKK